ncbi:MAG: ATP-grasp domain-containing protein [Thermoplasmata archaeon]
MNILVTGAGGPAGVCVIKCLRGHHRVISTDIDPLAAGLYLSDRGYVTRRANDPRMVAELIRICSRERVKVLLPTVQEELMLLARSRPRLERAGIVPVVAGEESLAVATDKLRTYAFFRGERYCPKVYDRSRVEFPAVVKPTASRGGRGFHRCENSDELRVALARNGRDFGDSVIMEFVPGTEFSVYGLSGPDGIPLVVVPVRRIQAVSESKKAEVVADRRIQRVARDIATKLRLSGPWNIQLMKTPNRIVLIEVNPRFAGTTSLVVAAGVNLPELAVKLFLKQKIRPKELEFRDHLLMTRYNEEVFLSPADVKRRHR